MTTEEDIMDISTIPKLNGLPPSVSLDDIANMRELRHKLNIALARHDAETIRKHGLDIPTASELWIRQNCNRNDVKEMFKRISLHNRLILQIIANLIKHTDYDMLYLFQSWVETLICQSIANSIHEELLPFIAFIKHNFIAKSVINVSTIRAMITDALAIYKVEHLIVIKNALFEVLDL